jgi:Domain of unknown function (DUF3291)
MRVPALAFREFFGVPVVNEDVVSSGDQVRRKDVAHSAKSDDTDPEGWREEHPIDRTFVQDGRPVSLHPRGKKGVGPPVTGAPRARSTKVDVHELRRSMSSAATSWTRTCPCDGDRLINMSLWQSIERLAYVYHSSHRELLRQRSY